MPNTPNTQISSNVSNGNQFCQDCISNKSSKSLQTKFYSNQHYLATNNEAHDTGTASILSELSQRISLSGVERDGLIRKSLQDKTDNQNVQQSKSCKGIGFSRGESSLYKSSDVMIEHSLVEDSAMVFDNSSDIKKAQLLFAGSM